MNTIKAKNSLPEAVVTPSRFRNPIGKFVVKRNSRCAACGLCAELCPYGVHIKPAGYSKPLPPRSERCIGTKCELNDFCCVKRCPNQALSVSLNPTIETMGDYRWTPEMIIGHWHMAETGELPEVDLEYSLGSSGGGRRPAGSGI